MIKVAIVGTGNISTLHIKGLLKFSDKMKIVALVDIYPEKAQAKKKEFELHNAVVFSSHKEMLSSGIEIDLVHNCTPPFVHAPISIDCMNEGINVLVEKPMATCLAECDAMIEASVKNDVVLASVAQNRFQQSVNKLNKLKNIEIAGKVRVVHVNSYWWRGENYYNLWWRGLWEREGGGPTLNHAVHHLDMLNWIQRELPTEVTAVLANVMHPNSEVEDLSFGILKYQDGSIAQVTSSTVHHGEEQGIDVQFENAKISTPFSVAAENSEGNGFPKSNQELIQEIKDTYDNIEDLGQTGHAGQIEDLLDALIDNRLPKITGIDGRNTIELISAIYKSGCEKRTISLPLLTTDPFYSFDGIVKNATRFNKKSIFIENFTQNQIAIGRYEKNAK